MRLTLCEDFPTRGLLALAGSGEFLTGMETVDQHLLERLEGPARVVCLPTAAGTEGEERIRYWSALGERHFSGLGVLSVEALPVIDRASAQDPQLAGRISSANFVYLSGGKPDYLYDCLVGSPAWEAILSVLEEGGVVAGCSAGAMIFGERIPNRRFPWKSTGAFGFLPGAFIIPHFNELPSHLVGGFHLLAGDLMVIGIEGFTVLVCSREGFYVDGQGSISLILNRRQVQYRPVDGNIIF